MSDRGGVWRDEDGQLWATIKSKVVKVQRVDPDGIFGRAWRRYLDGGVPRGDQTARPPVTPEDQG